MFPDHDNQSNAAAAAPAPESESVPNSPQTETNTPVESAAEETAPSSATEHAEVVNAGQETQAAPTTEQAEASSDKGAAHAAAEAHGESQAVDAEAAAAAEEAAGSEEMSKLMEQYDEKQEAAASSEIIEVKVVAYTEHGVVVDLGGKTEGLIPAAEFAETEIPRPDPNATIEVQRTGRAQRRLHDRVVPESAAAADVGKDRRGVQGQGNDHGQRWWTASRAGWWWTSACARSCRGRSMTCGRRRTWTT